LYLFTRLFGLLDLHVEVIVLSLEEYFTCTSIHAQFSLIVNLDIELSSFTLCQGNQVVSLQHGTTNKIILFDGLLVVDAQGDLFVVSFDHELELLVKDWSFTGALHHARSRGCVLVEKFAEWVHFTEHFCIARQLRPNQEYSQLAFVWHF